MDLSHAKKQHLNGTNSKGQTKNEWLSKAATKQRESKALQFKNKISIQHLQKLQKAMSSREEGLDEPVNRIKPSVCFEYVLQYQP